MFFLIDAGDDEQIFKGGQAVNLNRWVMVKVAVMALSLGVRILLIIASYLGINQSWSSFAHFIGVIFVLYYSIV